LISLVLSSIRGVVVCAVIAAAISALASPGRAAAACEAPVARAVSVQGAIEVRSSGESTWRAVQRDQDLCAGDVVRAGDHSRADLSLYDQSLLRLRAGTELTLEGPRDDDSYWVNLSRGAAHFLSRQGERRLNVETPYAVAGVRGTEFYVGVDEQRTELTVFEGRVVAANDAGDLTLDDGDSAIAEAGRAPTPRIVASPRDAVRWTLYYPPVVAPAPEGVTDADPRFYTARASERLSVGSVDDAAADVARALDLAPDDADALALEAVIAVAQGRNADAQAAAERSVAANPKSGSAYIALSYAEQARFDLAAAQRSSETAVEVEPENALAWARLAELRAASGDRDGALLAAEQASYLEPKLSRTQTVLGFAHLVQVDTQRARRAFQRAIALDQGDPMPHLGLGLAQIRDGDLHRGAREIEIAASLDPGDALIRSYLGKAYYEEKRTGLDLREFDEAKELDPNDPTPWFYEAIAKQTTNRPVQALQSLEEAIDRNDQRAVNRSRLMLDSDAAARSASLGRIYSDLGFENLALVEGWKAVNTDVANHSGHRLLADSYASQPRSEIARVSELFQAQMLQPNNLVPIQPRQGEGSLFLLSSQGPSNLSFTEFNPLFERNRAAVQANGLVGGDDTYLGEGIVSAVYDRLSVSAGYSGYWTDGFRDNNDQDDNVANAFAQFQVTPETSIQSEFRYRKLETGDLELRFLEDDFSRFLDERSDTASIRGGARHEWTPNTTLLLSLAYEQRDTDFDDFIPDPFPDPILGPIFEVGLDVDLEEVGYNGEGQLLHRQDTSALTGGWIEQVQVVAGAGGVGLDVDELTTTQVTFFGIPDPTLEQQRDPDVEHANTYLYTHTALPADFTLTLGASGDFFHEEEGIGNRDQFNPKGGIIWTPSFLRGTTIRAAGFRVLKRTLVNQQTLEPTQVAGFNQFFDDPSGTEAWRYGAAIDQKLGDRVFVGAEGAWRELQVPIQIVGAGTTVVNREPAYEKLARTYVFLTPHDWIALRAEYQFERIKRDEDLLSAFTKVTTHRVPLGVELFHPWGWSVAFGATYLDQDGVFLRNSTTTFEDESRNFWVLDTGLRYRLPKRYGFLAFGVTNFLDEESPYQSTDVRNPSLRPGRFFYGAVTLAFP
jgi:tetratricopeptide (TPR) repeat protein